MSSRGEKTWVSNPHAIQRVVELFESGLSAARCAEQINKEFDWEVSRSSVLGILHRQRVQRVSKPIKTKRKKRDIYGNEHSRPDAIPYVETQMDKKDLFTKGITMDQLTRQTCRWPVNGNAQRLMFCGDHTHAETSYCKHHYERSVDSTDQRVVARRRRESLGGR